MTVAETEILISPGVLPVVTERVLRALLMLACEPVKLILVSPVQLVYPVDLVKPVVVDKLNVAPAGGFTSPMDKSTTSLALNPTIEKSPGSWLVVLSAKFAGSGEITLG